MTVLYGDIAVVNGEEAVSNWGITTKAEAKDYVASNTGKGTGRLSGVKDWSGDFECCKASPTAMPGAAITLSASIDGVKGVTGSAVAESLDVTCDIEGGGPVTCKVGFGGNGALTKGASAVTDSSLPNPPNAADGKAALGTVVASPVYTDLPEVTKWNLKISAKVAKHNSSSTSKNTVRSAVAKIIDCSASISYYFADPAAMPCEGDVVAVKLYVDASLFYEIRWMIIDSITDIKVDLKSQKPVGCTLNLSWSAYTDIAGTPTIGCIHTPAATPVVYWPFSA